jgi:hypothetical protein
MYIGQHVHHPISHPFMFVILLHLTPSKGQEYESRVDSPMLIISKRGSRWRKERIGPAGCATPDFAPGNKWQTSGGLRHEAKRFLYGLQKSIEHLLDRGWELRGFQWPGDAHEGSGVLRLRNLATRFACRRDARMRAGESQRAAPVEPMWVAISLKALLELEITSLAPRLSRISVNSSR